MVELKIQIADVKKANLIFHNPKQQWLKYMK